MFPGHPTQLSGKLIISGKLNEPSGANLVLDTTGALKALYFDDTTPHDDAAIKLALGLGLTLLCAVGPDQIPLHHRPTPPCANMAELYKWGLGEPWIEVKWGVTKNEYEHVIAQHMWPGTVGKHAPPPQVRAALKRQALKLVAGDPDRVWLF